MCNYLSKLVTRFFNWLCGSDQQEPQGPDPVPSNLARSTSSMSMYQPENNPQMGHSADDCEMYAYRHELAEAYRATDYNPYAGRGGGGRNLYRKPVTRRRLPIPRHLDDTDM